MEMETHVTYTHPQGRQAVLSATHIRSGGMPGFHHHDEFEMMCFLTGEGQCFAGGSAFALEPGHLYVIPPDTPHRTQYDAGTPHSLYHIYFRAELLDALRMDFGVALQPYFERVFSVRIGDELRSRMDYALSFYNRQSDNAIDHAIQQTLAQCVLLTLAKQIGADPEISHPDAPHPIIRRVLACMEQRYDEPLTLASLSAELRCSKSYLCRLFRQATGQTLVDYLNAVRIRHACRLLEQTNLGVSQVSQLTGFNSVVYFDRQFRRFTGQTPTAYTAQHRF